MGEGRQHLGSGGAFLLKPKSTTPPVPLTLDYHARAYACAGDYSDEQEADNAPVAAHAEFIEWFEDPETGELIEWAFEADSELYTYSHDGRSIDVRSSMLTCEASASTSLAGTIQVGTSAAFPAGSELQIAVECWFSGWQWDRWVKIWRGGELLAALDTDYTSLALEVVAGEELTLETSLELWGVSANVYMGLTLQAVADRLAGDANYDDCVDGLDYVIWSNNYLTGDTWEKGDFNGDGIVDGLDYVVWSNNYLVGCPGVPGAVPEPSCAVLLALGFLALRRRFGA